MRLDGWARSEGCASMIRHALALTVGRLDKALLTPSAGMPSMSYPITRTINLVPTTSQRLSGVDLAEACRRLRVGDAAGILAIQGFLFPCRQLPGARARASGRPSRDADEDAAYAGDEEHRGIRGGMQKPRRAM